MRNIVFLLLIFCLLVSPARAEILSCPYFSVDLPDGWQVVTPPAENQGMTSAVFVRGTGNISVSLLAGDTGGADIKTIAGIFAEQYQAKSPPALKNRHYVFNFTRHDKPCQAWIAVQDNIFMVTTLVGNPRMGLRFIKKSVTSKAYPGLLPQ
ncbi:MAG: hypothetical protein Q4F27_00105 [Desulfovibrionaceae bacterium]|nr:hypothetical protein [Desulfovibrionaceae bacterium]